MLPVYTLTILVSAALLFLVEPMIGRMILPRFGGSSSVWIACLLFFQTVLLAGYGYAHVLGRRLAPRAQVIVHGIVLLLPVAVLPLGLPGGPGPRALSPALLVLALLAVSVGPAFFVLSTSGPLLQRWFASTTHPAAGDPYFLYAAGNAGSLAALLCYPLLVEPALGLRSQSRLFSAGYLLFVALAGVCGVSLLRSRAAPPEARSQSVEDARPLTAARRLLWVLLAFAPSSVLLAATQYMTTDVAAVPLLWVVPLALYLLTFILAFSPRVLIPRRAAGYALGALTVALAAGIRFNFLDVPLPLLLVGHLAAVLLAGLVCHAGLAESRPTTDHLTEFYLLVGLGGALGGVFNALIAPLLFDSIAEYPLALILACALRPAPASAGGAGERRGRLAGAVLDLATLGSLAVVAVGLEAAVPSLRAALRFAIVAVPCLALIAVPRRMALGLVALMLPAWFQLNPGAALLHAARTFYGVHRVLMIQPPPIRTRDAAGQVRSFEMKPYHLLQHGTTGHGIQYPDPELASIPTAYYHRSGPIGQVFAAFDGGGRLDRAAMIGLGAGTLAAYGRPGRRFTFIEIDPEVVRIARDPALFTYLRDSKAEVDVVVGDGRTEIARLPDGSQGLVVVDAFSSDSIPVHMITREAIELYMTKLRPDGLLALHLTNEYLDLTAVIDSIALDLRLSGLAQDDGRATTEEQLERKMPSTWAVLARDVDALGPLAADPRWERLPRRPNAPPDPAYLWTDEFSNLVGVLRRHHPSG
ncbi:MAG: fused MFS/spermidine synthase [Acidobacteriia bacterium]|nr:fused MFS/spermidine synthase [Terriglobia bacterium]